MNDTISKPKSGIIRKSSLILLELFFILFILVTALGGAVVWRLSQGDLDAGFVKENIEDAINFEIAPFSVKSERINFLWDNLFERPVFTVQNLKFYNEDNNSVLTIEEIKFTLSRSHILFAQIIPRNISISGVDLHLVRMEDGSLRLGFLSGPALLLPKKENAPTTQNIQLKRFYEDNIAPLFESSFLQGLDEINLENSFLVYEDLVSGQAISFPGLTFEAEIDADELEAEVAVNFAHSNDEISQISLHSSYDIPSSKLFLDLTMQEFNPFLWGRIFKSSNLDVNKSKLILTGQFQTVLNNHLNIISSELFLKADSGRVNLPSLYDEAFALDAMAFAASYDHAKNGYKIEKGELSAYGLDLGFESFLPLPSDDQTQYSVPIRFTSNKFDLPLPEKAYPDAFEHEKAYEWLTEKLAHGTIYGFDLGLSIDLLKLDDGSWDADANNIRSNFNFEDLKVLYLSALMPLTNARGAATLNGENDQFIITGEAGNFEDIDLSDITVTIDRLLAKETGFVTVDAKAQGKLSSIFRYTEPEPIGLGEKMDIAIDQVQGDAALNVIVGLPTSADPKLNEMKIDISGTANEIFIPKLVNKMDVRGGPMQVSIKDNMVTVQGNGQLDTGYPATFKWQRFLKSEGQPYKMKVDAQIQSDHALRQKFGVDVSDYVSGKAGLDLVYTEYTDNSADIDIDADLTNAELFFAPLNYVKNPGDQARATLKAYLKNNSLSEINSLNISGPNLDIQKASLTFQNGDVHKGVFPENVINQTRGSCEFVFADKNTLKLKAEGPVIDAGPFMEGPSDTPYTGPAVIASINAKRMLVKKDRFVENASIYIDMDRQKQVQQFEMDGKAGKGDIYIRYKPDQNGRPILRGEIGDAGAALKVFDIYNFVKGGRLVVTGIPSDEFWKGNLSGKVMIMDFTLMEAPLLARLISALSLPGLGQLFNSEGIEFSKMEADFSWISRPQGSLINITDGRTAGSELGLTFKGTVDRAKDHIDLSGTIVPASTVNNIIGKIPILGHVITGGSGALIAATYEASGPAADPDVDINPLSVLAPGFLRRLFFEED